MAYGEESLVSLPIRGVGMDGALSTDVGLTGWKLDVITAAEIFASSVVPYNKCKVVRVGFTVQTIAAGTTTTPTIKVWKNNADKADAAADLLATIVVGTTAAGSMVSIEPSSLVLLTAGDTIQFELDVADVDGTPTSEGDVWILVEPVPDTRANVSTSVVSA